MSEIGPDNHSAARQDVPPKHPEPPHIFGSLAGLMSVVLCTLFGFAVLYLVHQQLMRIDGTPTLPSDSFFSIQNAGVTQSQDQLEIAGRIALEADSQRLRTMRAQSLAGARLTIQIIAELISLVLVVLGAALVFSRIRAAERERFELARGGWSVVLGFTFPGLLLCFLGTATIFWALNISVHPNVNVSTRDGAIYLIGAAAQQSSNSQSALEAFCRFSDPEAPQCEEINR
ncbi:hypothetical protein [Pararhodobacter sp. SW119]|uniref:hypothetical protein n=1 Tax=Pararhodobacter sp. SW119 TaxID=2780075 RepID=UPI001AE0043F|nr:hypothetical protein [Pararhodobacter sp. SW119]